MKTTIVSFALVVLLSVGVFANPRLSNKSKAKVSATTVEQQLSTQLSYPDALQGATQNSVVMVQYKINGNNRVSDVQVLTANKQLNQDLTRQLTGIKVTVAETEPNQVHTARLRFQIQ
ncbi:MAG: hypothetical protein LH609_21470 [Rudanella sp.]|nr:hypothetical protein [Rudanella sp.]